VDFFGGLIHQAFFDEDLEEVDEQLFFQVVNLLVLVRFLQVQDCAAFRAVFCFWSVELVADVALDGFEFVLALLCDGHAVRFEEGVVGVLADEVAVRREHFAVRGPAVVRFRLLFGEDAVREGVRGSAVAEDVRVVRFLDAGVLEVALEEVADGAVADLFGYGFVLVDRPEGGFWVLFLGVEGEPGSEVGCRGEDEGCSPAGFAVHV